MGGLPAGTMLKGQLVLGTNLAIEQDLARNSFLRFTEALTPDRKTSPVCMLSHDTGDGVPLMDNTTFQDARIQTLVNVKPVERSRRGGPPGELSSALAC